MERVAAWWMAWAGATSRSAILAVDGLLAVVLGALAAEGSVESAADHGLQLSGAAFALIAIAAAALCVRRIHPVPALAVAFGATVALFVLGYPHGPALQLTAIAAYSVAAWSSGRTALIAITAAVVLTGFDPTALLWLVAPAAFGRAVRAYRGMKARAAQAERRGYLAEERLRMAREVHDVVGHGLAVINLQAGVALHVLQRRPEHAAQALMAVRQASGAALQDLASALADRPPGLDAIGGLVTTLPLGVDFTVTGTPRTVSMAVSQTGYRVAQEALTNVVKHSRATRAEVALSYAADHVAIRIRDNGRGVVGPVGAGRGLVGMRERVAAVGGQLRTGPCGGAGFLVEATLPTVP